MGSHGFVKGLLPVVALFFHLSQPIDSVIAFLAHGAGGVIEIVERRCAMAYEKFKLNERNEYQLLQAVALGVGLLASGENEADGPIELGSEIDIEGAWDDVAVFSWHAGVRSTEYWQIKSQHTPLDMPTLLKMLSSALALQQQDATRQFRIGVPADVTVTMSAGGQRELELRTLGELCSLCKPTATAPYDVVDSVNGLAPQLQGWFSVVQGAVGDPQVTAKLLRNVIIEQLGTQDAIRRRTELSLAHFYADPTAARQAIERAIRKANSFTRVQYEDLACELRPLQRVGPSRPWTSFRREDRKWWQRGTIALAATVEHVWSTGQGPEIRLLNSPPSSGALSSALLRLALHSCHGVTVSCVGRDEWRDRARAVTSGTLGDGATHHIDAIFPLQCERALPPSIPAPPGACEDQEALSKRLHDSMHNETWKQLSHEIQGHLNGADESVATAWADVASDLAPPAPAGRHLLNNLLRAHWEPRNTEAEVRCGPRTIALLAQTIVLVIALRAIYRHRLTIDAAGLITLNGLRVTGVALSRCRNVERDEVVPITECLDRLAFGGGVLVMGGLETSSSALREALELCSGDTLAATQAPDYASSAREADVAVVWGLAFRNALRNGRDGLITWMRRQLAPATKQHRDALLTTLNAINEEEIHAA